MISSNYSRGDYFYFRTKRGRLFEGRRLFEGGEYFKYFSQEIAPKIFCFITSSNKGKSKIHECYLRKNCKRKTGAFVTIQLHSVVCYLRCQFLIWERGDKRKRKGRGGGGNYSREAIILNTLVKGGIYSKETINQGMAIIRGNTVYRKWPIPSRRHSCRKSWWLYTSSWTG